MKSQALIFDLQSAQPVYRLLPMWTRATTVILLSCLLIPRGVELQLGTIMIDFPRISFTIVAFIAIAKLLMGTAVLRVTIADWLMAAHVGVISFSALYHNGFDEGLETAVQNIVDVGLPYFVARVFILNVWSYRYCVRVILIIGAVAAVFGLIEMFTGYSVIKCAWHVFFSNVTQVDLDRQRLGLYRAHASFGAHILFGLYCAFAFALSVFIIPRNLWMKRGWFRVCLALCVLGTFASLSSGAWIALALCFFCMLYGRIMRKIHKRWELLLITVGFVFLLLSMLSNRGPIKLLINYLTLDPWTGYVRLAMWDSVFALMQNYWLIGWGWGADWPRVEWYMWSSVDSFYAVLLIQSGVFTVIALLGFFAYCWYKLSRLIGKKYFATNEAMGWMLATVSLAIAAITVDIFGNLVFGVFFLLGAGQTLLTVPVKFRESSPDGRTIYSTAQRSCLTQRQ